MSKKRKHISKTEKKSLLKGQAFEDYIKVKSAAQRALDLQAKADLALQRAKDAQLVALAEQDQHKAIQQQATNLQEKARLAAIPDPVLTQGARLNVPKRRKLTHAERIALARSRGEPEGVEIAPGPAGETRIVRTTSGQFAKGTIGPGRPRGLTPHEKARSILRRLLFATAPDPHSKSKFEEVVEYLFDTPDRTELRATLSLLLPYVESPVSQRLKVELGISENVLAEIWKGRTNTQVQDTIETQARRMLPEGHPHPHPVAPAPANGNGTGNETSETDSETDIEPDPPAPEWDLDAQ